MPVDLSAMKRWLAITLLCSSSFGWAATAVELGCKNLRVVLDARLSPALVAQEWGSGNPRPEAAATLELVGCQGQLLDKLVLPAALAQIDPVPMRGDAYPTYLVSADLTVEAGSYNGPVTMPIQIVGNHLLPAVARFSDKPTKPIVLTLTGKSAWRRAARRNSDDLLFVSSQPQGQGFVTLYRRYFLANHQWQVKQRSRNGLWESDADFPDRQLFPR